MITAKISASGRITIPKAIREQLNLRPGTKVTLEVRSEALLVKRLVASAEKTEL